MRSGVLLDSAPPQIVRGQSSCGFSPTCRLGSVEPDKVVNHFSDAVVATIFSRSTRAVISSISESVTETTQGRIAIGLALFWKIVTNLG